jgi:pyroglutamyl-peptidase
MLLLTGFEPFDKWEANPSWEVARALDGLTIGGVRVAARRLPVDWERSWPALLEAIEETHPRWVLMLGQGGTSFISVETRGLNTCVPRPDNAGRLPNAEMIEAGGLGELAATLPVGSIVESIRRLGLPVETSDDAGGYLCNHTLYSALAWARAKRGPAPGAPLIGFIHVPYGRDMPRPYTDTDPETPGMPLEEMMAGVRAAITAIAAEAASVDMEPELEVR